ncbi:aminoglycoside phosphotransferase family protein [Pacificispira sp.]|uniref:aminoglycoside phosphotransferase family protein n=1 Tax=Pacificispira sp. TaxID=2888761 RepID=UPI003B518F31
MQSDRNAAIDGFLAASGWPGAARRNLADDASFRRYERVELGGRRAVLMDAPPDKEDVRPFVTVSKLLTAQGLSAPEILAEDPQNGFLLLEDLGDDTYTRVLARGGDEYELYSLATDTLIRLQRDFRSAAQVPDYSRDKLAAEADLLIDWFWPAVKGSPCPEPDRAVFRGLWQNALGHAFAVPSSLVLRDYHVDNLIHLPDRTAEAACGLLDFQDAVIGPVTYDLVSLFEDARRDVPHALANGLIRRYLNAFPAMPRDAFALSYAVMGVQRATKIVGIFTRLDRRDGKSGYLRHIPRTWGWLEGGLRHPMLRDLKEWYDMNFPSDLRRAPAAASTSAQDGARS